MKGLDVVRVFIGDDGGGGNLLGVFLQGNLVDPDRRQAVAAELGYAETVFVDDAERGELRIFTPTVELPFAGHPLVGTAWLLARRGNPAESLRPPAGEVSVRSDDELTFVAARPEWAPATEWLRLDSPADVDALSAAPEGTPALYAWAWIDEDAGVVRSRSFAPGYGIPEDEATGSLGLALAAQLGRDIEIHQGTGSELFARPLEDGWAEVGGRVALAQRQGGG